MICRKLLLPALSVSLLVCFACNKPSDDAITTNIKAKLYSEPLLKSASVDVAAKDGVVTLTGQVPDDAARLAAEQIATKTPGVKTVVDRTTMVPPPLAVAENVAPPPHEEPLRATRKRTSQPAPAARIAATPAFRSENNPSPLNRNSANQAAETRPAAPAPPKPITVTIPDGTVVSVRTIDTIDSGVNHPGQLFRASLDSPIVVDDQVVAPKGLDVNLKLLETSSAGKFKGRSELTVALDSFTYQGKTYPVISSDVQEKGSSRGKRSAEVIGGGSVLGAIIGGLAGGGKGAAIGAAAGAGGGTAVQAMTHGQQVKIASETRLDFTLQNPVAVTYFPRKSSPRANPSASPDAQPYPPASADRPPQQ